jgi:predicted transcriptional regulator
MNNEEIRKELAKTAKAFSEPIDFDKLIEDGLIIKKGKSYYVLNIHNLPENIRKRIKDITKTKNGLRVTFYKETKKMKNLAEKFSGYLE